MPLFEMSEDRIEHLERTSFDVEGLGERSDIQRLLKEQIELVSPDTLVIAEEFADWEDSRRRIDLLGIDKDANLVVIELKRTEDGGHMELQAVRYAAMISNMTFDNAVSAFSNHLQRMGTGADARQTLLEFLDWEEPDESSFAQDVRIVLVSADYSREITSAVIWLNNHGLDIRCIRLQPYRLSNHLVVDAQQIIPLPEAADYQIRLREKQQRERSSRARKWDEDSFLKQLRELCGDDAASIAKEILDWAIAEGISIWWGEGQQRGAFTAYLGDNAEWHHLFRVKSTGQIAIWFDRMAKSTPFNSETARLELLSRFRRIAGLEVPDDILQRRLQIPLERLFDEVALNAFESTIQLMIELVRQAQSNRS